MTYRCKCGHRMPSRRSFRVSGVVPVAKECASCGRELQGRGTFAEEGESHRRSRSERLMSRLRG